MHCQLVVCQCGLLLFEPMGIGLTASGEVAVRLCDDGFASNCGLIARE
jgi:hypothetical protein